jgi:hypothetical protein
MNILHDRDYLEERLAEMVAARNIARGSGQRRQAAGCQKVIDGLLAIRDHRYEEPQP